MAEDINLLPEEFRDQEKKELDARSKNSAAPDFSLSNPPVEKSIPDSSQSLAGSLGKFLEHASPSPAASVVGPIDDQPLVSGPTSPPPTPAVPPTPPALKSDPRPITPATLTKKEKGFFSFGRQAKKLSVVEQPNSAAPGATGADLDINLIPQNLTQQHESLVGRRLTRLGLVVFGAVLIVGAAYLGVILYQLSIKNQVDQLNQKITELEQQAQGNQDQLQTAMGLQQRLKLVRGLLGGHQYWTRFFQALEAHTINEVYYTNFSMAGTDKVSLAAVGKDYTSVARQLVAFQQATDFVVSADVNGAAAQLTDTGQYEKVTFTINLIIRPGVFAAPTP